jgi:catechol 2,3-dioxygenase-like lactoylglutathione lyase family enzyme
MTGIKAAWLTQTPLVPTGGPLAEALAFYTDHLGFTVEWQGSGMAGVRRDDVRFNLVENSNRDWLDNSSISIGVSNLDDLYEEYKEIPARLSPPAMRPWGRRELHIIIPSGVCLQFWELS